MSDREAAPEKPYPTPDHLISLLGVYGTQFGSYTTLLWQVPALSLTAQSFLLTIALGADTATLARLIAALLSAIISVASFRLMHDQRGHAMNHGMLAQEISKRLDLGSLLGAVDDPDAKPRHATAETVWGGWDRTIYGVWSSCIGLFLLADALVTLAVVIGASWLHG